MGERVTSLLGPFPIIWDEEKRERRGGGKECGKAIFSREEMDEEEEKKERESPSARMKSLSQMNELSRE